MNAADYINDALSMVRVHELNSDILSNVFGGDPLYLITVLAMAAAVIAGIVVLALGGPTAPTGCGGHEEAAR